MNRSAGLALMCGGVLALGGPAWAVDGVRVETRIVPQTGVVTGVIANLPGSVHNAVGAGDADRTRRFEVQYRLVDIDPDDGLTPQFGMRSARFTVTGSIEGGGLSAVSMERARLTAFQASISTTQPPSDRDTSGTTEFILPTGVHKPFRANFPRVHPIELTDAYPPNGVPGISPDGFPELQSVDALSPGANFRYSPSGTTNGDALGDWYGLYSFQVTVGRALGMDALVRVAVMPDTGTGDFSWFIADDEQGTSLPTSTVTGSGASFVVAVPAPAALTWLFGLSACVRRRRLCCFV